MHVEKVDFLKYRLTSLLKKIPSDTPAQWGKMTLQQMIEHFADSVRVASGKMSPKEIFTPEEHRERLRDFMLSDKPFKENTVNPLMPVVPAPVRNTSVSEAINELQNEIGIFFKTFESDQHLLTLNPFFGDMNLDENVHLLYKHAQHHLKQFGKSM